MRIIFLRIKCTSNIKPTRIFLQKHDFFSSSHRSENGDIKDGDSPDDFSHTLPAAGETGNEMALLDIERSEEYDTDIELDGLYYNV